MTNLQKSNVILKMNLYTALRQVLPVNSVILPILLSNNLSVSQFFILNLIFKLIQLIFEVPTAFLADKYGRRNSMICSTLFFVISGIVLINGSSFYHFAIHNIFLSLSYTSLSGSDNSYFLDCLGDETFKKVFPDKMFYRKVGTVLGGVISAGLLLFFDYEALFIVQLMISFICLGLILSFPVVAHQECDQGDEILSLTQIIKLIGKDKKSVASILVMCAMSLNFFVLFEFYSPLLTSFGIEKSYFALIMTIVGIILAISMKKTNLITSKFKDPVFAGLFYFFPFIVIMTLWNNIFSLLMFIFPILLRPICIYIFSDYTASAPSKYRTVYDSFFSFVSACALGLFSFVSSQIIKYFDLRESISICFLVIFLFNLYAYFYYKKHHPLNCD